MVKFYSSSYSYDYSFPAVSLAYFLRYPNPYSTHVTSTDVIERSFDTESQRLTTVRLHVKRSKLPTAVVKLLPRSVLGTGANGDSQSFILEKSVVDNEEGWMKTESRNLDWTGVLTVIEEQEFRRPTEMSNDANKATDPFRQITTQTTDVSTTVTLRSNIGDTIRRRTRSAGQDQEAPQKVGFFKSWTTGSIQRSIELIGLRRAEGAQPKAKQGMQVVLERLRQGGLVGVLEGMRQDQKLVFAGQALAESKSPVQSPAVEINYPDD